MNALWDADYDCAKSNPLRRSLNCVIIINNVAANREDTAPVYEA